MICKKCGANIADTAKFCTSCGSKVEVESNLNDVIQNNPVVTENEVQSTSVEVPVEENLVQPESVQTTSQPVVNQSEQLNQNNSVEQTVVVPPIQQVQQTISNQKKKNNTWIFVVGGVVLGIIAIALMIFAFSKSSNNSIKDLEKALNNLVEKGDNSGTINAAILMESDTGDSYNLSATIKYAKNMDSYDMALTLNKSMLYDEMNFYLTGNEENATLYAKSSLVDMLGFTSSATDMWLYYLVPFDELDIKDEIEQENVEYDLSSILDDKHYKFIGKEDNLKHYQLIIDNELVNKIKSELTEEELEEFEDSLNSLTIDESSDLIETYYIDIYINESGDFEKISMDLTNQIDSETFTKVVVSFGFSDFGSTSVEIPSEAKSSTVDLETYMSTYSSYNNITEDTSLYDYGI